MNELIIDVATNEVSIALLEDKQLVELNREKGNNKFSVGDIYLGKVRKIMPTFIAQALTGTPIEIYGDGEQIMDMVYVADVAQALVDGLTANPHITHQIGTARPTTVNEIADMERLMDWGVDGIITDRPDRLRAVMQQRGMALPAATVPLTPLRSVQILDR